MTENYVYSKMAVSFSKIDENNSHEVIVGHEQDYVSGQIRIEPPVRLSKEALVMYGNDVGVEISPYASDQHSSIYEFHIDTESSWSAKKSNRERLIVTMDALIADLGMLASRSAFIDEWSLN